MAGRILAYYALLLLCILKNYTSEKILQSWDFLLGLISCHMQSEWVSLSSVQSLRCVQLFATPWATAHQASRLITSSRSLLKLMSIDWVMPSNHLILCCPFLLLPSNFPSIRVFSNKSVLHIRWASASASVLPWIFRIDFLKDWLDWSCNPRDYQLCSPIPQFKSINSSALTLLYVSTLTFIHDYWKTIALTRWTFVGKVMSLLFNMLPSLVITFLPRSKCLLISWL